MDSGAQILVVGAGIVGCSAAYHLSLLGATDVLVVEQGPLPATGGSSSHAPGLVFQTNASQTMTQLARHTVRTWAGAEVDGRPCFHQVGGIEVATTPQRWDDLHRKLGLATAWGVEAELLGPAEVAELIPHVPAERVFGGLHVPSDGIAKPVRAAEFMAREARRRGVRFVGDTEITGFDVHNGRIRTVRTSRGDVSVETVLCCAGIWGPKVGALAGVSIPVQPLAHQYAVTGPVPGLDAGREVAQPILRHQDSSMYFRQIHDRYGVGSYQHRAIPVSTGELAPTAAPGRGAEAPSGGGGWKGMASVHPFTPQDFKKPWSDACDLLPVLGGTDITEGMNGLFLFTSDGMPVLGPSNEVGNFWAAEAVWITHAAGVGKAMAEWMTSGVPEIDLRAADIRRFEGFAHSPSYVGERSAQSFREVYDIIHPQQPPEHPRPLRTSPFYPRQQELGGVFLEANGWERPHWFESNGSLADGRAIAEPGPWAGRYWSPIVGAEHQVTRERAAMYDMTSLARAEVSGRGALELLQRLTTNQLDRPPGYVTYTLMLEPTGGIRADITVARLSRDVFQVGCNGPRDIAWLRGHADETVSVRDITGGTCCIGLWGPRARDILAPLAGEDISHEAFRFFRARRLHVREVPVTALRLSYVGELGWELYTSAEFGLRLWDLLAAEGAGHGAVPAGRGAFNGLRMEKGYRAWGTDMWSVHDPDEAGLDFAVKTGKGDFVGRDALLRRRENPPRRKLCCVTIDDGTVLMGSEPVLKGSETVGFTTSAGYGYSVGQSLAYAWLPAEMSGPGTSLQVSYFDRRHPVTVVADPVFDPEMRRMRC
ncbi:glycine cleavage system aminomethyltransferase T [Saccharopolyspora erythraea NRRL 2338]|uniref:FAD-dependent oxidoreductase n=1 Tax=Saccharopolyspora erythraea TaxID=1836 RepID=A0ABN1DHA2_SACER|nr:FAD-dependent oxidoreductase [Saccharopolyspora erythraea]EQD85210.1 sarcosine dehydrogenase [Saccharopolyspora erythraea D]PFG98442.1 glycine cleavage system aminomethyltransferase T [Saccharopolyspora erythraea NRRL 2338]QRK88508.1 FAD-dependent oxidoreductase [Saccharopolyspora erythraea]